MFADDCIIFRNATTTSRKKHQIHHGSLLKISGQSVNYHKSNIQFSKGINKALKTEITDILQITSTNSIGTYLGCLNIDKRRTKADLEEIRCRIGQKRVGKLGHYPQ